MKRREAIKNLLIVTGGVIVLPSCLQDKKEASIPLKYLAIDADGEKLLAELAETIIPATNIPGAKDTYAHVFALNMVDDCFEQEVQEKFTKGIKEVDRLAKDRFDKSFTRSTPAQREQIVAELEKRGDAGDELSAFYATYKKLIIQGYLNSRYVLTNVLKYELVPGRYTGAAPVKQTSNKI
jgi:hypothetical protein